MTTRVMIVDDEPLIRSGIHLILDGHPEIEVVAESADGQDAVRLAAGMRPHVVFMDIRMPGMDGIEATRQICAAAHPPAVIMLTAFDTEEFVLDAVAAGAGGFLLKTVQPQELISAVHSVTGGAAVMDDQVLRRLVHARNHSAQQSATTAGEAAVPSRSPVQSRAPGQQGQAVVEKIAAQDAMATLSDRERQVAKLIAHGLSNADIAGHLFLSLATVKTHVARIFDKLGRENRVQVAILVLRAEESDG